MKGLHVGWVTVLVCVVGLLGPLGCQKPSSRPETSKPGAQQQGEVASPSGKFTPSPPEVRCLKLGDEEAPSVIYVQGYPLVFTGQVFPEAEKSGAIPDALEDQLALAWKRLETILEKAGSKKGKIVRIGICIAQEDDASPARVFVRQQFSKDWLPAITTVVTPLPYPKSRVAFDAVAYLEGQPEDVRLVRLSDDPNAPHDAAVCPQGGLVFFSGQPDKNPLPRAVENAMKALFETAQNLHVEKKDILQIRVFLQPMSEAPAVLSELRKAFPEGAMPPVIFVEWIASAPVEIEMIARLPAQADLGGDVVRFYNPPGVKPSATFSRVTLVRTDRFIFFPALLSRKDGSGAEQVDDIFAQLIEGLKVVGSDIRHLLKATYYVVDKEASDAVDDVRKKLYDPQRPPAASKVTIHGVGQAGRTVSVDMIAAPAVAAQ